MMNANSVIKPLPESTSVPFSAWRMLLTCLFINSMIGGAFLSGRVLLLAGFPIAGSALLFPLTYYILALVADVYGLRTAWRLVWCGMICLLMLYVCLELIVALPPAPGAIASDAAFKRLYDTSPPAFIVIALAFFVGQAISLYVLGLVKERTNGQALLFRLMGAPLLAQVATTLLVLPLLYTATYTDGALAVFTASRVLIAVIYSTAIFPLLYAASRFVRRQERGAILKEVLR